MTNLDSVLKSRDIILLTKVCLVKAMVFPVVMYGCESWTIKKAECRRINALELWCWRRLLRVPWTARSSNQSVLKEINPKYSLERLKLKREENGLGWGKSTGRETPQVQRLYGSFLFDFFKSEIFERKAQRIRLGPRQKKTLMHQRRERHKNASLNANLPWCKLEKASLSHENCDKKQSNLQ